jgi:hypothetical protein
MNVVQRAPIASADDELLALAKISAGLIQAQSEAPSHSCDVMISDHL